MITSLRGRDRCETTRSDKHLLPPAASDLYSDDDCYLNTEYRADPVFSACWKKSPSAGGMVSERVSHYASVRRNFLGRQSM